MRLKEIETVNDTLSSGLTTPLITTVHVFNIFCILSYKTHSRGVWLRLNETETVYEALSLGSYDPTYNLKYNFWIDLVVGLSVDAS